MVGQQHNSACFLNVQLTDRAHSKRSQQQQGSCKGTRFPHHVEPLSYPQSMVVPLPQNVHLPFYSLWRATRSWARPNRCVSRRLRMSFLYPSSEIPVAFAPPPLQKTLRKGLRVTREDTSHALLLIVLCLEKKWIVLYSTVYNCGQFSF